MKESTDTLEEQKSPTPDGAAPVQSDITDSEVDENLDESFPASDPPSWTLGTDHQMESSKTNKYK